MPTSSSAPSTEPVPPVRAFRINMERHAGPRQHVTTVCACVASSAHSPEEAVGWAVGGTLRNTSILSAQLTDPAVT